MAQRELEVARGELEVGKRDSRLEVAQRELEVTRRDSLEVPQLQASETHLAPVVLFQTPGL